MVLFRSPLGLLSRARGGARSHPPHLGWAVRVAMSLGSLQPGGAPEAPSLLSTLSQARDLLRVRATFKTKSKSKQVPLESLQIPRHFSLVQQCPLSGGAGGVEEAERRFHCSRPTGPSGSSGAAGVGEGRSGGTPPSLKHIPGLACPLLQRGGSEGGACPPPGSPRTAGLSRWILVLVPCVTKERGPRPLALTPALCSLKWGIVLVQELPNGPRQLGDFLIGVQVAVDGLPTEMLESGHVGGEGPAQHQRDLLAPRVDVIGSPGGRPRQRLGGRLFWHLGGGRGGFTRWRREGGRAGGRHVVMHQLEHAVEARHRLRAPGVALQREAAPLALDAQVLGPRLGLDAEREEVALVRAVADEEGAGGLGAEQQVRLAARHRAPVEAALLQLAHCVHHQLVLALGAEGLEAQAGVQGAAHPGGGKLAVGDHGARSQRGSARRRLQLLGGLRTAAATASRGAVGRKARAA